MSKFRPPAIHTWATNLWICLNLNLLVQVQWSFYLYHFGVSSFFGTSPSFGWAILFWKHPQVPPLSHMSWHFWQRLGIKNGDILKVNIKKTSGPMDAWHFRTASGMSISDVFCIDAVPQDGFHMDLASDTTGFSRETSLCLGERDKKGGCWNALLIVTCRAHHLPLSYYI